jgi:hypothetical protein
MATRNGVPIHGYALTRAAARKDAAYSSMELELRLPSRSRADLDEQLQERTSHRAASSGLIPHALRTVDISPRMLRLTPAGLVIVDDVRCRAAVIKQWRSSYCTLARANSVAPGLWER